MRITKIIKFQRLVKCCYKNGRKKVYHISYPGSKIGMFIAKNYKMDSIEVF